MLINLGERAKDRLATQFSPSFRFCKEFPPFIGQNKNWIIILFLTIMIYMLQLLWNPGYNQKYQRIDRLPDLAKKRINRILEVVILKPRLQFVLLFPIHNKKTEATTNQTVQKQKCTVIFLKLIMTA